uniref:ShKT domain-containing protein n=1 Tax=Heterorhabditis bacteriophora TaxID=37862 RepID=A0A1I7WDP6_HETBA
MNNANSEEKKQAMISICPKTCGYCCLTPEFQCNNKECRSNFVYYFIGFCQTTLQKNLRILQQSCGIWKKNGFCESTFYTNSQKIEYCAKSCGLC